MAKGRKPIVPGNEAEGEKQSGCFHSEDLECRSQKLGLALMRKQALGKLGSKEREGERQSGVARAVKLSSEFLASIIVGVVLGLGFDKVAGSLPWGLVFSFSWICCWCIEYSSVCGVYSSQSIRTKRHIAPR